MNYYAIQVKTSFEHIFINKVGKFYSDMDITFHAPIKQMNIHKKGVFKKRRYSIFPGYVFLETEDNDFKLLDYTMYSQFSEFYKFLPSNRNIKPLKDRDLKILMHFIKTPVAGVSKVYFNDNDRIVVVEGIMSGLEGYIIKVDKRRRRAKIKLDLCNNPFIIDLSFDVIGAKEKVC